MARNRFVVALALVALVALLVPAVALAASRAGQVDVDKLPRLSPELLAGVAGAILSLALSYIPGLNKRYASLSEDWKKLIMLVLLALASLGVLGLSCAPLLGMVIVECSTMGALQVIATFIAALIANQSVHRISPQTAAVRAAKHVVGR